MTTLTQTKPKAKTVISEADLKKVGISAAQLSDDSIIEALVSEDSNVRQILDHRLVGRFVTGEKTWSAGDLFVAGVALKLSYLKADGEDAALVKMVQGSLRAHLAAATTGSWKPKKEGEAAQPFRLTPASAKVVLEAIETAQKTKRGIEIRTNIKAAKAAIAQLEADGVDAFLLNWGGAIKDQFSWVLDVVGAARTGIWASDGSTFKWDGRNAHRVLDATRIVNETWDRANRVNAAR